MGLLTVILALATVLGGLAAIWFFWDKLRAWVRRLPPSRGTPPSFSPSPTTPHPADVELFERIRKVLPFEPVGRFLKEHDFAGWFWVQEWAGIHAYMAASGGPDWGFMDSALESLRLRLTRDLDTFLQTAFRKVWSGKGDGTMGVPDDWLSPEHPRHADYWPAVDALNAIARKAYDSYEMFIRLGRSKLRVP